MRKALFGIMFIIGLLFLQCGEIIDDPPGSSLNVTDVTINVNIAGNEATLIWNTDIPSTHQVEYGIVSGTYPSITTRTTEESNSHTEVISGLSSPTYYFRVKNYAEGAEDYVSREYSFSTSTTITITNISVSPSLTSATITWDTSIATTHNIEYGISPGTYIYSTVESASAVTSHSVTLSGLTSGTIYYYIIKCYDTTSAISIEQSFTTTGETFPTLAQKLRGFWMVGGLSGTQAASVVSQLDLFDPVSTTWYSNVALDAIGTYTPVSFAGIESYKRPSDGHHLIIVIGGFDSNGVTRNLVQIYDIEDNEWSNGTVIPAARAGIYAARVYDKIFIMGGNLNNASGAWNGQTTNYEYTIDSGWNTRTAVTAVSERFLYAFDDIVYHIGGRSAAGAVAAQAHEGYSVTGLAMTGAGSVEVLMSTPRTGVTGKLWNPSNGPAKVLLLGGFTGFTGTPAACIVENAATTASPSSNLFQYLNYPFTAPSTWIPVTAYPLSVGFGSAAIYGNIFYHFGGTLSVVTSPTRLASGSAAVYSTDLTGLPANIWNSVTSMPIGRYGHTAVTIQQ